jgi:hypothetical protein
MSRFIKIREYERQSIKQLDNFIDYIFSNVLTKILQYQKISPIPSRGIKHINGLLLRADLRYVMSKQTDLNRFLAIDKEYKSMYSDMLRQYPIYRNMFVDESDIAEVILYTDSYDLIETLPIGSDNWDNWKILTPINILSVNSLEFTSNVENSKITYDLDTPSEIVLSINIPMLLNMYVKYRTIFKKEFELRTDNSLFIYRYCIVPMIRTLLMAWNLNMITEIIDSIFSFNTRFNYTPSVEKKSYYGFTYMNRYLYKLSELTFDLKKGKITPSQFINTVRISDTETLAQYFSRLPVEFYIQDTSMNSWLSFVRDYQCMLIIKHIFKDDKSMSRTMKVIDRRLRSVKTSSVIKDPMYRANFELKQNYLTL